MVVEDDDDLRLAVTTDLAGAGLAVDQAADLATADAALSDGDYDCVVFDRILPDGDSIHYVQRRRERGWAVPVLFLTARDSLADRVAGFEHGGDDYLVKPFAFSELMARVNALARRPHLKDAETVLRVGDLEMDLIARTVTRGGDSIDLQPREFRLLEVLMRNKGRVLTRTMLLERVWSFHFEPRTSVVETHVSRLRAKIDRPYATELIHTVRGSGYTMHDQQ
jgi:two-component system OmpR family response regulator